MKLVRIHTGSGYGTIQGSVNTLVSIRVLKKNLRGLSPQANYTNRATVRALKYS
jgi:hypothetical protein